MLEPVSRGVAQDVFGFHSVFASKFLDSYSVFDWGRMPDSIPHRGKLQAFLQAFIHQKISSVDEWKNFLRSPDALAFRKAGRSTAHLNELADLFPMKSSHRGIISEESFHSGKLETLKLTPEMIQSGVPLYLLDSAYPEEKVSTVSVLGKTALDFSAWKNKNGPKALPFEFDCEFNQDFPEVSLRVLQSSFSTEISFTEALLITELPAKKMEEVVLRAAWIAGFIQYQLKSVSAMNEPINEKKVVSIRMGMDEISAKGEFVFLGAAIEFSEIQAELQKYYSSTVWGKVVADLQQQARARGFTDWKRYCSEPAPWLDPQLKNNFSNQYQKMISGIASCLSE